MVNSTVVFVRFFLAGEANDKKLLLTNIYELIPAELNDQNKRFKFADVDKSFRFERMSDSFNSALDNVMRNENYDIKNAIVFSNSNVEKVDKITYLPIYMIMFIEEESMDFADISIKNFKL